MAAIEPAYHLAHHLGVEHALAPHDAADGRARSSPLAVLRRYPSALCFQEGEHVAIVFVGREHQHSHLRVGCLEGPGGLDAVELGHAHVHDHHVWPQLPGETHGLFPICGLAHHGQVRVLLQEAPGPLPYQIVVFGQQDAYEAHALSLKAGQGGTDPSRLRRPGPG